MTFSIDEFKKWMMSEQDKDKPKDQEEYVVSRVSLKKLMDRIDPEDGDVYQLSKEFRQNGGKVLDRDGDDILVEVKNGTFFISRFFVEPMD